MIESEINLIADKLGMTITQVYRMNVEYQHFVAIQNVMMIITCILTFAIFMIIGYYKFKTDTHDLGYEWLLFFGLVGGVFATVATGFLTFVIFNSVILPMQYPEYTAMTQTMHQIQSFIPSCEC